jgi:hypothetical protein
MRSAQLELDVLVRSNLRDVGLHGGGPCGDDGRWRDIDQDWHRITGFGFGAERVKEQLSDSVWCERAQLFKAAVASQPHRIAHQHTEPPVVRVLILDDCWRQHDVGPVLSHKSGQRYGVGRAKLEMCVAIELDELERRAQQFGRGVGLGHSLVGAAVRAGFALRTDDQVHAAAGADLQGYDCTTAELDIVRMRPEDQE